MNTARPVLVLKLYHHGGIGVVRSLGRLGVPVHAIHDDVRAPAARSRYLREVLAWDFDAAPGPESLEFVLEAGRRIGGPPVLLAADDTAQAFVSDHAAALREVFAFPHQPEGLTQRLFSKQGLHALCREHDVATPLTAFPQTREEAREALERAVFPLLLKPIDNVRFKQRNGIPMYIAQDASDALAAYDRLEDGAAPNVMLQEYIPGPSSSVWVFTGYFDRRSELVFGAGGAKLRQYPIHTGTTCFGVVRSNPEMEAATARFVKALGYGGVFDCGYRYDARDGRYKLLDVNPRVGANFRQCVGRGGLDVVRALYLDLTGQEVPADVPAEGRRWWVENYDVAAAVDAYRAGELSARRWVSSLRQVDELAWFAREDLAPFRAMCAAAPAAFGRRLLGRARAGAPQVRGSRAAPAPADQLLRDGAGAWVPALDWPAVDDLARSADAVAEDGRGPVTLPLG
jgi:predicted ATP-grasp superfamily ATP-dependent carboligase